MRTSTPTDYSTIVTPQKLNKSPDVKCCLPRTSPQRSGNPRNVLRPANRPIVLTQNSRILEQFYADEPFIVVDETSPSTKATLGANTVHITARVDERTGWLPIISALDNLRKAPGAAIQCANIALGLDETSGLPTSGLMP